MCANATPIKAMSCLDSEAPLRCEVERVRETLERMARQSRGFTPRVVRGRHLPDDLTRGRRIEGASGTLTGTTASPSGGGSFGVKPWDSAAAGAWRAIDLHVMYARVSRNSGFSRCPSAYRRRGLRVRAVLGL